VREQVVINDVESRAVNTPEPGLRGFSPRVC
jgi:hypothetical protein